MKTYAVIILDNVIDVVVSLEAPSYPPDSSGNEAIIVPCDSGVSIGMKYVNGTFIQYTEGDNKITVTPTNIELAMLESQATLFEEMEAMKLANMEASAEIYEAILGQGDVV